ncbi:MAG: TRAP transporter large permease subunit [Atribacterota bacterium]|nr:TRAP transporter large permease subunit [Atribacterota bacterium]MDD5637598.1 TRAP transporter large permease subunit [Atribacterota bacterium]
MNHLIALSPEMITVLMLGGVLTLVLTGFPIGLVIGSVAFLVGTIIFGPKITFNILYSRLYELTLNYPYLAVPLFTFMGVILENSGIAEDLYNALYEWLSGFKGGLAVVTIIVGTLLAACLGTITASVTILTLIALAPMIKRGYDKSIATGSIVAAGTLGILIPPSIMLVVYGPQAGVSVGKMFMGAIFPGLILSGLYITYITIRCALNPKLGPPIPEEERHKISYREKTLKLLKAVAPTLLIIIAVLGTIYTGIAPPTEAAAMGSLAVVILAILYRKFTWNLIKHSAMEVLRVSAFVLLIAGLSYAFVGVFMSAGCGGVVTNLIMAVPGGRWGAFAMVMLIVFVLGMFIEWIGIVFIIVPVFSPILLKLGFDPLWAAMMICINLQMAFQTPPMAMSIFVCRGTAPKELGVTMADIIKGVVPFIILIIFCLILCIVFPQIITWLPEKMIG